MKLTSRTTITNKQIAKIRLSKLKSNPKKSKYILSNKFITDIKKEVRQNRIKKSNQLLKGIVQSVGQTEQQRQTLKSIFGESTKFRKGRKITVNKIGTITQFKKLQTASKQVKIGTFNLKRRVSQSTRYKETKKYLPDDATTGEILDSLDRTEFYFENRDLVIRHNKGDKRASNQLKKAHDINKTRKAVEVLNNM